MDYLHCNYSALLAQELDLEQYTNIHVHRFAMDFYEKVEIFEAEVLAPILNHFQS